MRRQVQFPSYESFYSSLKGKNVDPETFEQTKMEYERRLALPEDHPEKYRNFSDYLKTYQMR